MNVIAPVFAPGAQTSPAIEDALRKLMVGNKKPPRHGKKASGVNYRRPAVVERQKRVKELHSLGRTAPQIGRLLGYSANTIWYDIRYLGLPSNVELRDSVREAAVRRPVVAEMMAKGDMTLKAIGEHLGVSPKTISKDAKVIRSMPEFKSRRTT